VQWLGLATTRLAVVRRVLCPVRKKEYVPCHMEACLLVCRPPFVEVPRHIPLEEGLEEWSRHAELRHVETTESSRNHAEARRCHSLETGQEQPRPDIEVNRRLLLKESPGTSRPLRRLPRLACRVVHRLEALMDAATKRHAKLHGGGSWKLRTMTSRC